MKPAAALIALAVLTLSACQSRRPPSKPYPFDDHSAEYTQGFQKGFLEGLHWSEAIADQRQSQTP